MAAIHKRAMVVPAPWSATAIQDLLNTKGAILSTVPNGFAIGRVVLDEAELLTIAVDPDSQGQGFGQQCLNDLESKAERAGAARMFLEVAENNRSAMALYRSAGYTESGRRTHYYKVPSGGRIDAILMEKRL